MSNDPIDHRLSTALHERAGAAPRPGLGLDDVRRRAHSIRRRRRVGAAVAVVAAVSAIAVPLSLLGTGDDDAARPPVATDPSTPAEQTTAVPQGQRITIDLNDLPEGDPATVPYAIDGELHLPGGATAPLENAGSSFSYDTIVPLADGWMAIANGGEARRQRLDATGRVVELGALGGSYVVRDDASGRVAWTEYDGEQSTVVVADAGGDELWRRELPSGGGDYAALATALGFRGEQVLVGVDGVPADTETGVASRVYAVGERGESAPVATGVGMDASPDGSLVTVREDSADATTSQTCYTVVVTETSEPAWPETCTSSPQWFSPDGSLVSVGPAEEGGLGAAVSGVVDARTGESVAELVTPSGAQSQLAGIVWESPTAFVVAVRQSTPAVDDGAARYGLVRVDLLGGEVETAAPTVPFDEAFNNGGQRYYAR